MELKIDRITKQYANKIAVDRVSCTLTPGVIGLLGANGAGKTTLMRMICGILKPTSGTLKLGQYDVSDSGYRNLLGYLPQDFGYYPEFTGMDFMLYMATLKGLDKGTAKRRSRELLERVNLLEASGKKTKTYSGGMKQRLGIAQVLLNHPQLVVLDEPTAGLDPKERVPFRHIIEDIEKESIVLLSTHIVSDIEKAADRILVIKDGQKVFDGTEEETGKDLETFYLEIFGGEE
ncbi:ABC transporter ATP-binding protein [Blautia massiliensis (ex Durand et al. 2017)]|uniref:ABC transporter ATP-binding protein n=1 Tax=Blautia massiliensis (ex Durand et al. 2017) TaxID=1737424 RepID=UPI0022E7133F|nr:ABC transporter ATP-binding protein [Blautia massiliensis (ex Durand et al. 2017)]